MVPKFFERFYESFRESVDLCATNNQSVMKNKATLWNAKQKPFIQNQIRIYHHRFLKDHKQNSWNLSSALFGTTHAHVIFANLNLLASANSFEKDVALIQGCFEKQRLKRWIQRGRTFEFRTPFHLKQLRGAWDSTQRSFPARGSAPLFSLRRTQFNCAHFSHHARWRQKMSETKPPIVLLIERRGRENANIIEVPTSKKKEERDREEIRARQSEKQSQIYVKCVLARSTLRWEALKIVNFD